MTTTKKNGISVYPSDEKLADIIAFAQVDVRSKSSAVMQLVDIALKTPEVKQKIMYFNQRMK